MERSGHLSDAVAAAERAWMEDALTGSLAPATTTRYVKYLMAFNRYAQAHGVLHLDAVDERLCRRWIFAPLRAAHSRPGRSAVASASSSTCRGRQIVLRRAVRLWMDLGLLGANPVPADVIRTEGSLGIVPLTPLEVGQLRLGGRRTARDTLLPALVEAALAGVSQQSMTLIVATSIDATQGVLDVPSTPRARGRGVPLGPSGVVAMRTRVADVTRSAAYGRVVFDPASTPLLLSGPGPSRSLYPSQAVASNLKRALDAAGVDRPGVTAGSLQAFAANACYALTQRVEDVAQLLGLHSLDSARARIDRQWQTRWADQIQNLDDR